LRCTLNAVGEDNVAKLATLQKLDKELTTLLTDINIKANDTVSRAFSEKAWKNTPDFANKNPEVEKYYEDDVYAKAQELSRSLRSDIIARHKTGIWNNDSFKNPNDHSPSSVKRLYSDFESPWKKYRIAWKKACYGSAQSNANDD
jgi:hypothetical protein